VLDLLWGEKQGRAARESLAGPGGFPPRDRCEAIAGSCCRAADQGTS
jgi:hypothetical protein